MDERDSRILDIRVRLEALHRGLGRVLDGENIGLLAAAFNGCERSADTYRLLVHGLAQQVEQVAARLPVVSNRD